MAKRRNQTSMIPILLMVFGALLIIGAGVWYFFAGLAGTGDNTQSASVLADNYSQIPRLSVEEAKAAYDSGSAVFVDVRDVESFNGGHIQGALSIPLEELAFRLDELDPSTWIITY